MSADARRPYAEQVTEDLVLIEVAGQRVLASARCPHRGGLLRFGYIDTTTLRVRCPLHHSTFDIADGRRTSGPACDPLRIVKVLDGGAQSTEQVDAELAAGMRNRAAQYGDGAE